ncbi:MAG: YraN family protein [Hydrogenovibrio sp.]|uniref:YraN family protein n=1 Tax=Hydrogenovibrio sp. TaxID=2065821 RepID=UPI0028704948|nr:YraN family protein [Hydrogenovibrio sp.]MDR9498059.1 YraN family protein [Hydrogenovibrio sp.]
MGWLSQRIGQRKENQAADWLKQQGIALVMSNYRCKGGEIDLIGQTSDGLLVFFEVKHRQTTFHGHPAEALTAKKQQRLFHAAQWFLQQHPAYQSCPMRFDLLTFVGNQTQPQWLPNAFGGW